MRLSRQLMAVSLLMLGLPWAGCQYLRELESALREGQEQALVASARAIAASFSDADQLSYSASPVADPVASIQSADDIEADEPLYAEIVDWPIIVDGYDNEWQSLPVRRFFDSTTQSTAIRLRTAIKDSDLYLYLQVRDDQVRYQNPSHPVFENGDRLVLHCGNGQRYVLLTGAPGDLPAYRRRDGQYVLEQAIEAQWQDNSQGYSMELVLPLRLVQGRLGFILLNEDRLGNMRSRLGNMDSAETHSAPTLIYRSPGLSQQLQRFEEPGLHLRLINSDRWRIADTGSLYHPDRDSGPWFLRWLYRTILQEDHPDYPAHSQIPGRENRLDVEQALHGTANVGWFRDPDSEQRSVLAVAMPVVVDDRVRAVLLAEESNERFLGLTDRAFQRLLLFGLIAFFVTGVGLVSYAAWLSWRIRRLNRATAGMIHSESLRLDRFPNSQAQDEIGELTRSFRQLFVRIHHYTEYLQTLSRKLTHELRTPLAVVRTSLDNMSDTPHLGSTTSGTASGDDAASDDSSGNTSSGNETHGGDSVYLQRARDGAARLSQLLTALSEATRMEEAIQQSDQEPLNLAAFLNELVTVYQQLHPSKQITLTGVLPTHLVASRATILAAPDLLAQMFDKLVANAVDFTPDNGEIHFHYQENSRHVLVDISNDGPLLPAKIRHQIFDQLVSARGTKAQADTRAKNNHTKNGHVTKHDTPTAVSSSDDSVHLGLGLYIVRLVVEYHQGHIRAENRPDKRGVVFSINLPLLDRKVES